MRLVSVRQAGVQARAAAERFPLVLVSAGAAATAGIALINAGSATEDVWIRLLMAGLIGLPLLTAVELTGERAGWPAGRRRTAGGVLALLLALLVVLSLPWSETLLNTRFAHLLVASHLLVAVLPFGGSRLPRAFWQYNRILLVRFLITGVFAVVLFAGLAIALAAIDNLFGVDIDEEVYAHLFVLVALIFHPWFFLGGVPRDLSGLDAVEEYPNALKIFAQFILIPVVTVYLLILTAYLGRVLITRTWPSGWIGWLVSSVAAAGTLALLLVHPVRERADSRWVDAYGRWFYVALLPSAAMLLVAIWQRIEQYGFTERRYFLTILAVWLAGISLYYAITASRNIRIIPASLCMVALLTLVGPWSAYAVSRASQAGRLEALLVQNEILVAGGLQAPGDTIPFEDRREISATVRYLVDVHGPGALGRVSPELQRAAEADPPTPPPETPDDPVGRAVVAAIGVPYVSRYETTPQPEYLSFHSNVFTNPVDIAGFDVMIRTSLVQSFVLPLGGDTLRFELRPSPQRLEVMLREQPVLAVPLTEMSAEASRVMREAGAASTAPGAPRPGPPDWPPLVWEGTGGGFRIRIVVHQLFARDAGDAWELSSAEAVVLVGH